MGQDKSTFRAARGIVGATGASFSNAYDMLERDGGAYLRSMESDPVLPPSLFVSENDRLRHNRAVPLAERCLEDVGNPNVEPVQAWHMEELLGPDDTER